MKRKAAIAIVIFALLLGVLWFVHFRRAASLPRIQLAGGGEFRVFKVSYGTADHHRLGGPPSQLLWLWRFAWSVPASLWRFIPNIDTGGTGVMPGSNSTAISIYWAWIDPVTQKAVLGPSGDVLMTTDSGEETNLDWPIPFDRADGEYRQIIVNDLPTKSARLRFRVPVEDETVEFTIDNPAYQK